MCKNGKKKTCYYIITLHNTSQCSIIDRASLELIIYSR